ncbi:helix-turn-helix DNA binding domain protein [Gordonia phage Pons]|uniref:Helix-turn-helix DNA binding domain protein n=5 Tax=Ponsvirus TaxID=3044795 RepID=A0AAE9C1W9_9CAUD|nr:transcriptional regulator [Gordonia phage Pons]YP_010663108.1 transcriptional regulator [Gordonia phage Mayweather]YP_010663180.1 transcriptional regulator [Gordonia phage CherryonLim]YP_010663391.1 transcriptional regulator [Gordonia phage BigChungus]YP_010663463.1 transcriptional regulator [Gordonia phage Vine]QNJ59403.1 helix-turn-helix DNA binding domain protein [Gordonia phage Feastonyeet]QDP45209.1 helix-turn-helix DNA binding protein [Gordonia phage Mayweather]QFP95798.1 helix-turn
MRKLGSNTVLAHRLKLLRKQYGLSQQAVADLTGISRGTIANVESHRRDDITVSELMTLGAFFNQPWYVLADGTFPLTVDLEGEGPLDSTRI